MYSIAILGSENSHAINFAKLYNGGHPMRNGIGYHDIRVIGAYGPDEKANKHLLEEGGVEYIADNFSDFLGKVDGIMITARHGGQHLRYAEPYLKAGIPMFVDKPITIEEEEAVSLARIAKYKGIPLCGGSCCGGVTAAQSLKKLVAHPTERLGIVTGGTVVAPINMRNEYGDFFFYSQHLVQIMMEIFGYDPLEVCAYGRQESILSVNRYRDYDVTGQFGPHEYAACVFGSNSNVYSPIDIATDGYAREAEVFAEMLRSGRMKQSYEDFIKPVFVLNALHRSLENGGRMEKVNSYSI